MTDEQALLIPILERPDDDLPRLVFADWLEEHATGGPCPECDGRGEVRFCDAAGDMDDVPCRACGGGLAGGYKRGTGRAGNAYAERAEFIRIQCELARLSVSPCGGYYCDEAIGHIDCEDPTGEKRAAASKRSRELLEQPSHGTHGAANWCVWSKPASDLIPSNSGSLFGQPFEFRRGFVEHVTAPLATLFGGPCGRCDGTGQAQGSDRPFEWSGPGTYPGPCPARCDKGRTPGIAPRLFASQPVTRVTLTDREPADRTGVNGEWYWFRDGRNAFGHWSDENYIPDVLFDRLDRADADTIGLPYTTRAAALDALSAACVAYGRANAEGMSHTCRRCERQPGWAFTTGNRLRRCPDCKGDFRRPGLPPLAPTAKETAS